MSEKISLLPKSNGSRYYLPFNKKVAIIADKDMFNFYENSAQITYITPSNWNAFTDMTDILLITNSKQGLNGEWWGLDDLDSEKRRLLAQIIENYRVHGAKIVFSTTERPGDYQDFLEIAKLCDYIFTASEKRITDYQTACNHDRVYTLKFGVNPHHHNPVGLKNCAKISGAVFSGNWNMHFIEKMQDAEMIFDGIVEANQKLKIAENYPSLQSVNYFYADRHIKYIIDVEKEDLQDIHKLFDWAVTINSLNHSKGVFTDHVYALQASGNIVLSNYNEGINNLFPHIFTVVNKEEIGRIMSSFDKEELYEQQIQGIRRVMTHDTNYQRMYEMLKIIDPVTKEQIRTVAIIVQENNPKIQDLYLKQSYPHKELLLEEKISDDILEKYDFIAYFDNEADYGTYYLEDMLNAFKYTDVDFVTKKAYFLNGKIQAGIEHDYVDSYEDKARTIFSTCNYISLSALDNKKGHGYAVDRFEFKRVEQEKLVTAKRDYKLSVIVPAFNNGERLYCKAFASLRRSTMFRDMEIIIVDDGSSDKKSLSTIKRLAGKYDNVKAYLFPKGGSGSASRPRNKGMELATTEYITYLDPDDEMINDGFTTLYNEISSSDYSMVVGDALMITHTKMRPTNYYKVAKKANKGTDIITDPRTFLIKTNLKPMHLMSLIVKREIIIKNNLTMVEGAFGEDTLFYHELVLNAQRIKIINKAIFLYYRIIENSATNGVAQSLFEKYLLREQVAKKKYDDYGILQDYLERRYERFFKAWYFPKLKQVSKAQWGPVIKTLKAIIDLHAPYYMLKDDDMIKFYDLATKEDYPALREVYVADKPPKANGKELKNKKLQQQAQVFKEEISANFLFEIEEKLKELPVSNGSRYFEPFKVKIAIIADEYMYEHCKNSAIFIYVTPHNYKDYVGEIDVFLITNVQTGLDNEWTEMADPKSMNRRALTKMISDYREAGAKIVYCATKEQPDSKVLIGVAKNCDYVFTTATEKVATYKTQCRMDQVHILKWGVNPLIHNPIGCRRFEKYPDVIFSRSTLDAFLRISKELRKVFDGVILSKYGLTIVRQDFKVMKQQLELKNTRDFFPQRYWAYILETVGKEFLPNMYKLYDWAINVNKVDSETVSNGVYELQAMGNLVLASGSGISNVFVVEDELQVREVLARFTDEELFERKMMGVRGVMTGETVYDHLYDLLCTIGIDVALPVRKVAVVVTEDSEATREMFCLQSYQEKELLIAENLCDEVLDSYDFIAYFSEGVRYGKYYLEDMINAFKYVDVDFVTKQAYVLNGELMAGVEHDFVECYEDKGRTVFSCSGYSLLRDLDSTVGFGYAVDRFGVEVNT